MTFINHKGRTQGLPLHILYYYFLYKRDACPMVITYIIEGVCNTPLLFPNKLETYNLQPATCILTGKVANRVTGKLLFYLLYAILDTNKASGFWLLVSISFLLYYILNTIYYILFSLYQR